MDVLACVPGQEYYGDCDKASDDESQRDQNEEKVTDETVAKSHITKSEDIEILTSSTLGTDPLYFSAPHPTIPDSNENSEDDNDVDEKKATEENQKGERKNLETCSKKGVTNTEMQSITPFSANSECCLLQYKITVDLKKTISLKTPQHVRMPNRLHDECDQGKATEKSKDITSSPIFSYRWQNILRCSTEGGRLRGEGSDVVLTVPSGAVEANTKVTVHSSVCVNEVHIKHKLQLPSTETIVSPLAEFWAGPDFHFKKHVQITLPTCLPSDYDVDLLHVYCITREEQQEGKAVNKIQRLKDMTQTPDKEALETFCLNWSEVACVNSKDHLAVKYTELGPFTPGWTLKSKTSENGVMPSTLKAFLLVSHLKTQESVQPLWSSVRCQFGVQPLNGKEKCVSNGTSGNCPVINIENVHGDSRVVRSQQSCPSLTGSLRVEEEPDAEMVIKSPKVARRREEQYFQESFKVTYHLAERSEDKDEHTLKLHQLQKTMQQERQPALEPERKVPASQRSSSGRLDWKEGHHDPFDIYHRENLTIHHLPGGRWENKGSFSTKNETELHINMYPTAKV
ncbi:hypothetical protein C0Q70_03558 [Pomacea canaliculata]|uniref:ZU5 domain-containing protein n=1 Tax=Pomacea canaliculata TaxID=400727 RepID=A0A2T7PT15_POMCA|nr:hypothetical protein C0Q70_03558 [Pomacea canaliculata]